MKRLLRARGLSKSFTWRRPWRRRRQLKAVDEVNLDVYRGECLAVVGESGSGKTTLGRCLLRLLDPDAGEISFDGDDLMGLTSRQLRRRRVAFQMVFQDSAAALDPRMRISASIAEPIRYHRLRSPSEIGPRVTSLLELVGLAASFLERYPHQLSGGQRQRVCIARALATEPKLLLLDEPVSALDVSVRAQILGLLADLRQRLELTMICIAHDLAMVEQIADRVAVMYFGKIVEIGSRRDVFEQPQHPYTRSLLRAVPIPDPRRRQRREVLTGEVPSPLSPPAGCAFHPRCATARSADGAMRPLCVELEPELTMPDREHSVACHYPTRS